MKITNVFFGLAVVGLLFNVNISVASEKPKELSNIEKIKAQPKTLDLCVDYSTLTSEAEKEKTVKELLRRNQLGEKDLNNLDKNYVQTGNSMCGMYMILGIPLQESYKKIRPMVFKALHIYPDYYYVTQMGIVVAKYERIEGEMPPELSVEMPKVAEPPVKFNVPGGRPIH